MRGGHHFTIRTAHLADAARIRQVHCASIRHECAELYTSEHILALTRCRTASQYRTAMRDPQLHVSVSASGTRLAGFTIFSQEHLYALYVHPRYVRCGIGGALLQHAEQQVRALGAAVFTLKATLNAVTFYQRNGYIVLGQAVHRLGCGTNIPCVEMQKILQSCV